MYRWKLLRTVVTFQVRFPIILTQLGVHSLSCRSLKCRVELREASTQVRLCHRHSCNPTLSSIERSRVALHHRPTRRDAMRCDAIIEFESIASCVAWRAVNHSPILLHFASFPLVLPAQSIDDVHRCNLLRHRIYQRVITIFQVVVVSTVISPEDQQNAVFHNFVYQNVTPYILPKVGMRK